MGQPVGVRLSPSAPPSGGGNFFAPLISSIAFSAESERLAAARPARTTFRWGQFFCPVNFLDSIFYRIRSVLTGPAPLRDLAEGQRLAPVNFFRRACPQNHWLKSNRPGYVILRRSRRISPLLLIRGQNATPLRTTRLPQISSFPKAFEACNR